jgi:hypothetical protein
MGLNEFRLLDCYSRQLLRPTFLGCDCIVDEALVARGQKRGSAAAKACGGWPEGGLFERTITANGCLSPWNAKAGLVKESADASLYSARRFGLAKTCKESPMEDAEQSASHCMKLFYISRNCFVSWPLREMGVTRLEHLVSRLQPLWCRSLSFLVDLIVLVLAAVPERSLLLNECLKNTGPGIDLPQDRTLWRCCQM